MRVQLVARAALVACGAYVANQCVSLLVLRTPPTRADLTDVFGIVVCLAAFLTARRGAHATASHLLVWGLVLENVTDMATSSFAIAQTATFVPVVIFGAGLLLGRRVAIRVAAILGGTVLVAATLRPGVTRSALETANLVAVELASAAALALVIQTRLVHRALLTRERAAAEQARALVEHAPDGIVVLDGDGRVLQVNDAADELLASDGALLGASLAGRLRRHDGEALDVAHLFTAPQQLLRLRTLDGRRELAVTGARLAGDSEAPALLLMFRAIPAPPRSVVDAGSGESLHVMVVDDDAIVREALGRLLRREGHVASVYASAEPALEALGSGRERPDVVLSDVMMPGMHGADFARAARAHDPGLPLVLMSGDPRGLLDGISLPGGPWVFLAKPFPRGAVQDAIARARRAAHVGTPPRA